MTRDLSSERGATALARELDAWWHTRGFPQVHHWIERAADFTEAKSGDRNGVPCVWCVKSNLINGLPPRRS